jgi:hypothetical protein
MTRALHGTTAFTAALALLISGPAHATLGGAARPGGFSQPDLDLPAPPPEEADALDLVRTDFIDLTTTLMAMSPLLRYTDDGRIDALDAQLARIQALTDEELQVLHDSISDRAAFHAAVQDVKGYLAYREQHASTPVAMAISGTLDGPTDPDYSALCGFLRDNEDVINGVRVAYSVAVGAGIVAQALCDTLVVILGEGTNAPFCVAAGFANGLAEIARTVIEEADECNNDIAEAQVEAIHENTKTIIEAVTCLPVASLLKGHGCDGADNDCDQVIDDCAEDTFGPDVRIDGSLFGACFKTVADAIDAVAATVQVSDDCRGVTVGAPVAVGVECDVPITVTAEDECGNASMASTTVKVDADGAAVSIDPAIEGACYPTIAAAEAAVLGAAAIVDNCSDMEDLTITVHSSVTECGLRVRLDVVDECGNASSTATTVRVDTALPTVEVERLVLGFRGEVLGFQTPPCYASVPDAEAAVLGVTRFADNCTARETLLRTVSSAGDPCALAVTSRAEDECANANTDVVTVRVDTEAPMVSSAVEIASLWPPNHAMIDVGFTYEATDNCPGGPEVELFVTTDEPTAQASGAGQTSPAPDAEILRELDGTFAGIRLRAERSTSSNGRVYRIDVKATDPCGNEAHAYAFVSVPMSDDTPAVDDGQYFDATDVN